MVRKLTDAERQEISDEHWSWIRMMVVQMAFGSAIGALAGYLFIHYDVKRLGTMIANSQSGGLFTAMIMFSFATLFGVIALGFAVWMRADRLPEK